MRSSRRTFYAVAALSGLGFGVLAVAVPMHVAALHRPASLAGQLLASVTLAVAAGAFGAGAVGRLVGGPSNLLTSSIVLSGAGQGILLAASSTTPMRIGALLTGAGIGLFWVASQTLLGEASGASGSERGFAYHYAAYTIGVAAGSAAVGVAVAALRDFGVGRADSIQLSYGVAVAAMAIALLLWRPGRRVDAAKRPRMRPKPTPGAVAIQLPDLLLVAALGMILPLAPLVLLREFHLAPFVVGMTVAAVQAGKVGGTLAGRAITRQRGHRRAIVLLLGSGAVLSLVLSASSILSGAPVFILTLVATAFVATGAWPLIVDSALARTEPHKRPSATVTWNVLEYGVIAASTASSGWLLASTGSPELLFVLGAAFLLLSALSARVVMAWPVYSPDAGDPEPVR